MLADVPNTFTRTFNRTHRITSVAWGITCGTIGWFDFTRLEPASST